MIKFILAIIAITLVGLVAYTSINSKEDHVLTSKVVHKTKISITKKEPPSVDKDSSSIHEETTYVKTEVPTKKKINSEHTTIKETRDTDNPSLLDDVAYEPNINGTSNKLMTDEDFEKVESDLLKDSYLNSEIDMVEDAGSMDLKEIVGS